MEETATSRINGNQHPSPDSALGLLSADHARLRDLFDAFDRTSRAAPEQTERVAGEICRELRILGRIEQEIVYPAVGEVSELSFLVQVAIHDHAEFNTTADQIEGLTAQDDALKGLVLQLREEVERHLVEEAELFFPQIAKMTPSRIKSMGVAYDRLRQRLTEGS